MSKNPVEFKWRHFHGDLILQCVRWYCKYGKGFEVMRMFKKGQFNIWMYGNRNEVSFINQLFHLYS